tara:strand:- start:7440 stop:7685 length:246 start_codon:yes stop_codon:yes gene_type:complete
MARIEVDVDIDIEEHLDEVDTEDLIDELLSRKLDPEERAQINKVFNFAENVKSTLLDELKAEIVMNGIKSKSIQELEIFFK